MEYQSFTVAEAAKQLAISPSTLRRWCSDFADYLSEGARPDKGVYRRLSSTDIQVLAEAKALREQGLSVPTIREKLNDIVFSPAIVESPQAVQESPGASQTAFAVVDALQSVVAPLEARLQALEQAQRVTDSQRQRIDVLFLVTMAFIAGLIVGLAVWWFQ